MGDKRYFTDQEIDNLPTISRPKLILSDEEIDALPSSSPSRSFFSYLGESVGSVPTMLYESIATPINAIPRLGKAYTEGRSSGYDKLESLFQSPLRAWGLSATRSMAEGPEKEAAKREANAGLAGGLGGAGIGAALGTLVFPGVGTGLGGYLGGLTGGVVAGETQRNINAQEGLVPKEPLYEQAKRGLATATVGAALPKVVEKGTNFLARTLTNPLARGARSVEELTHRTNNPNSLIASALTRSIKENEIRGPFVVKAPGSKRSTVPYSLEEAVSEYPDLTRGYQRRLDVPEFAQLSDHLSNKITEAGKVADGILSTVPDQPVGATVFNDILEEAKANAPFTGKRPYVDVLFQELSEMGRRLLTPDEGKEFSNLMRKYKSESYGANTKLTPSETTQLQSYLKQIDGTTIPVSELRKLKTQFDELGRWSLGDQGEYAMRKDAFREIANNIRSSLSKAVEQSNPDYAPVYNAANRRMYLANKFRDLANDRFLQQKESGQNFRGVATTNIPSYDAPIVGGFLRYFGDKLMPQLTRPEAMLRQADTNPFNFGTGRPSIVMGPGSTLLRRTGEAGTRGLELVNRSAPLSVTLPNATTPPSMPTMTTSVSRGIENMGEYLLNTAMNKLTPADANAQDFPILPRNTDQFGDDQLAMFLMKTASTPQAPIAQDLVKKFQKAKKDGDITTVEKLHSDMARLFPDFFEPGQGVNGKLFYQDEQAKAMDLLKELHRLGQVDSIQLAKQKNAFNNSQDGRLLPVTIKRHQYGAPANSFVNGTRTYPY